MLNNLLIIEGQFFLKFKTKDIIGRAKRAPHWAVQSRFRVINICVYVGLSRETHTKNKYAKMRGRNYVVQTRACSKSVLGG